MYSNPNCISEPKYVTELARIFLRKNPQLFKDLAYHKTSPGDDISSTIEKMCKTANYFNMRVASVFNGVQIIVSPGMRESDVYLAWENRIKDIKEKYSRTMKAEVARRASKIRNKEEELQKKKIFQMLVEEQLEVKQGLEEDYENFVKKNSLDSYGKSVVQYSKAWGIMMQRALAEGNELPDVAEEISFQADCFGMSGYSYALSVSFLVKYWKYGEELRIWHNLQNQVGTEGEEANKKEGSVLNPALLNITVS